ncbi:hypothetical protein [Streptomyces griseochromogenes]|uniref:hypothetical protein n=1 Tax=Streptomyces griseochromogenes TaxID=68214 RepID=UPI0037BCEF18
MSITTISKPIALAVAALAVAALALSGGPGAAASGQPAQARPASPTVIEYYSDVRHIRFSNLQCTAQLDAKKTAPGHWFVVATFRKRTDAGICAYYLWRNKGHGEYKTLSHGVLRRDKVHQTAWYWDGPGYHVVMGLDDGSEKRQSEPY